MTLRRNETTFIIKDTFILFYDECHRLIKGDFRHLGSGK